MHFKIQKADVLEVLAKIQGLTGRKSNLAITNNVLITTTDDAVVLIATDLETGFKGEYPAVVNNHGTIAINAKKFFEIVRDFPSNDIDVAELEKYWIKIGNESVEYNIVGMNPEDFPEIPQLEDIEFLDIESSVLKRMIDQSVFITGASDEKRAHILGIFFEIIFAEKRNIVRLVSTDGNRLSKADCWFDKEVYLPSQSGVLVPKKGMNEVAKFLDASGTVQIGIKNSNFVINKQKETIIIRLLEGDFPDYAEIIKKADAHIIRMNKRLFLMMLKRMSILSSEDYKGVIFTFQDDRLFITTTNPDIGESKEDMAIDFQGDPIKVAFNPRYFIETLSVIDSEKVVIHIIDKEKPCFIEGENDDTFLSVIMPMRI